MIEWLERSSLSASLHILVERLGHFPRIFQLIWSAAGRWTIAWAGLVVIEGLLPAAAVYLTRPLVDSISASIGSGETGKVLDRRSFTPD